MYCMYTIFGFYLIFPFNFTFLLVEMKLFHGYVNFYVES